MRIGILGCGFDCADNITAVLEPFLDFKDMYKDLHEVFISVVSARFKEFDGDLNINQKTRERFLLELDNGNIDSVWCSEEPLLEHEARNLALKDILKWGADILWLQDYDEFYTFGDIGRIVQFVEKNPLVDWFSINFRNYIFDGKQWIDGFCPPRIFRNTVHGGIDKLFWDNDLRYKDGSDYRTLSNIKIPRSVAHVRHMTWLHSNGEKKVAYQNKHFKGICSYKWNSDKKQLEFNDEFFRTTGEPFPEIHFD